MYIHHLKLLFFGKREKNGGGWEERENGKEKKSPLAQFLSTFGTRTLALPASGHVREVRTTDSCMCVDTRRPPQHLLAIVYSGAQAPQVTLIRCLHSSSCTQQPTRIRSELPSLENCIPSGSEEIQEPHGGASIGYVSCL